MGMAAGMAIAKCFRQPSPETLCSKCRTACHGPIDHEIKSRKKLARGRVWQVGDRSETCPTNGSRQDSERN